MKLIKVVLNEPYEKTEYYVNPQMIKKLRVGRGCDADSNYAELLDEAEALRVSPGCFAKTVERHIIYAELLNEDKALRLSPAYPTKDIAYRVMKNLALALASDGGGIIKVCISGVEYLY